MTARRLNTMLASTCLAVLLAAGVVPIRSEAAEAPGVAPVLTAELMGRLIKYTRNVPGTSTVAAELCKVFDICDGTADMEVLLAKSGDAANGIHYSGLPLDPDSKDILIIVQRGYVIESYLTGMSRKLRAATISDGPGVLPRLVTNERAAAGFNAELELFAKEAATLPPD